MDTVRSADGTTIAFERTGDGPPLIVVGGALSDRSAAADLAAVLAARFSVVAYDRRGRGDSGDTPPYAVEREVEDLAALLDAVGGSGFVLGHSSGAALAIEAVIRGLPITKVAVYEPPFIVDDSRPPLPADYFEQLDRLVAEGRRGDAVAYFMTTGVGLRVMGDHMSGRPLPAGWASDVTIPTLVIDGGNSPDWARNAVSAVAAAIPGAERRTLDGQEHGAAPEVLAPVLESFFAA